MITAVKKLAAGTYLINESVKVFNIDLERKQFVYDIDYDESLVSEDEAIELSEEFLRKAIDEYRTTVSEDETTPAA